MYLIDHSTFDEITMKAKAVLDADGKCVNVDVHATWAWAPILAWYDNTNHRWICEHDWKYKDENDCVTPETCDTCHTCQKRKIDCHCK